MNLPFDDETQEAELLYADFLDELQRDPSVEFETWLADHREHETELRAMHSDLGPIQGHLDDSTESSLGSRPAPTSVEPPPAPTLEGGHELLKEIGSGAYGRVWRARDRRLNREVALKVLDGEVVRRAGMRTRFLEEARILARLDHPNIVRVHSVEEHEGEIFISLELVEGRTVKQLVEADGPLGAEEAARIGADLCRALAAIHAQGLVHMDVKPGNVMRAERGRVVLLDFGFTRAAAGKDGDAGGPLGGTPLFMSPEQFGRGDQIGPRADLYSLGVMLYWLVAAQYPIEVGDFRELRAAVTEGRATPLVDACPDVPPAYCALVERAMATRPEERFASAGEMEGALREFLGGGATELAVNETTPEQPDARRGRRNVLAGVAVAGLTLVGLLAWIAATFFSSEAALTVPFDPEARFYATVGTDEVLLEDAASVALNSRLWLGIDGDRPFHLYVFNEDTEGRWFRLHPVSDSALVPGGPQRLPGPDGHWIVDTAAGAEHLFVVAASEPLAIGETLAQVIPPPSQGIGFDPRAISAEQRRSVSRGLGLSTASPASPEWTGEPAAELPPLVDIFADFERSLDPEGDVYFRHLVLQQR